MTVPRNRLPSLFRLGALGALLALAGAAHAADALAQLRAFTIGVKGGRADFTQTVTAPDGGKRREAGGTFAFARPDRFRFAYTRPDEQLILGDGRFVWLWDKDLNQVQQRPLAQALGATPVALLAGGDIERDFTLAALPSHSGIDWVQATPKPAAAGRANGLPLKQVEIGFRDGALAQMVIVDAFGQRSQLVFSNVDTARVPPAETFRFTPPAGADVLKP